jgi:hypothetical protein
MRKINCRNVRREIEEAAPGNVLSSSVNDHLANCVACEKLAREQSRLQQIVSSLGTVEAPGDFDFRLRARLAGEKPGSAQAFAAVAIGRFSFGLRSAALAMMLLVAFAFVLVSLRSHANNQLAADAPSAPTTGPAQSEKQPGQSGETAKTVAPAATSVSDGNQSVALAGNPSRSSDHSPLKGGSGPRQGEPASPRRTSGLAALDSSSTQAPVLTRYDQPEYPTSAFPIEASYQSVRVSVENGRGTSRTISLPAVSFGSKQALSQNGPPLVAAARDAW